MARGSGEKPPSPEQLLNSVSAREVKYATNLNRFSQSASTPVVNIYEYAEAMRRTGMNGIQGNTPMSAIPGRGSGFYQSPQNVAGYFGDDLDDINAPSMEFYALDEAGFNYSNLSAAPLIGRAPAPITESPTSSTNPDRPRTVGAGYDPAERKLTVIFRDGTYYNYFNISNLEWSNFKKARSKGRFILEHFDKQKPRGYASVNGGVEDRHARAVAYRFLRTGQFMREGFTGKQSTSSRRGTGYATGNLGGTGRARAKKAAGSGITGPSGVTKPTKPAGSPKPKKKP
jgi:hypothetical protein